MLTAYLYVCLFVVLVSGLVVGFNLVEEVHVGMDESDVIKLASESTIAVILVSLFWPALLVLVIFYCVASLSLHQQRKELEK